MYTIIMALPAALLLLLLVPALLYRVAGTGMKNDLWRNIAMLLQFLVWLYLTVISLLMGIVSISHEIRERSAKMILTRPVGFHAWIFSRYLAGLLIIAVITAINFSLLEGIFWAAGAHPDLTHLAAIKLLVASNLALYSYAFALSLATPPVLAGFLAMIMNGPTLKLAAQIAFGVRSMLNATSSGSPVGEMLIGLIRGLYVVFPDTFHSGSLVESHQFFMGFPKGFLHDAAWSALYSLDLIVIFYGVSYVLLKRKNLP